MEDAARRRQDDIINVNEAGNVVTEFSSAFRLLRQNAFLENLGQAFRPISSSRVYLPNRLSMPPLIALDDCIMAIVWEIIEDPSNLPALSTFDHSVERPLENLVILLRSAAVYQAKLEPDPHQLIAQSLICLHEALEIKRAKYLGAVDDLPHRTCDLFQEFIPNAIEMNNIPCSGARQELVNLMLNMGLPSPYAFIYHFNNGIFRGRAFAYFVNNSETRQVIDAMHNLKLGGKSLRVEYKRYVPQPGEKRLLHSTATRGM
ncbi:hypothetical protein EAF04_001399 [Stromatinia cepivora]|nr:hypothetical protein EAF04_001399 [Stromatinia cepivora]